MNTNTTVSLNTNLENDLPDQDEMLREYTIKGLKGKGISELVDIIIERAGTTNSSSQLDKVIEESRQISLNRGNYENVQNLIARIRRKLDAIRTEQERNRPKKSVALLANGRKRFGKSIW